MKLFASRPAETSRISVSAISTTTSAERVRVRRRPALEPRSASCNTIDASAREAWKAGTSPNTIALANEASMPTAATRASRPI